MPMIYRNLKQNKNVKENNIQGEITIIVINLFHIIKYHKKVSNALFSGMILFYYQQKTFQGKKNLKTHLKW